MADPNSTGDAMGWITGDYGGRFDPGGDLDEQAAEASAAMAGPSEEERLAQLNNITRCFRGPDGQAFLDWLKQLTVDRPCFFPADYPLGQDGQYLRLTPEQNGFVREGQNMVYREIMAMIDEVERGPQHPINQPNEGD